jgi:hypothetical protein
MVSAMSLARRAASGSRLVLAAAYVLLVLTLQPLLLDHAFATGSSHTHSDRDVCAWLDHAASAGVHSVSPPVVLRHEGVCSSHVDSSYVHSVDRSHDPVRGPPHF